MAISNFLCYFFRFKMFADHYKLRFLCATIFIIFLRCSSCLSVSEGTTKENQGKPEGRALFSPRVDYNEWMPVGRGDPLKNDPTYDYSPPVLDRVRYWGDSTKEKSEILLLGVPSKRQSNVKKETSKYSNNVGRRNYYPNLPTRLMPPPMQTISPVTKSSSTENYQSTSFHGNNVYNYHANPTWPLSNNKPTDPHSDESVNFVSFSANPVNSISGPQDGPTIIKFPSDEDVQYGPKRRKPWIHSLLEKEIEKPAMNVVMQPSKHIFESHSYGETAPEVVQYTTTTETPTYFQPTIPPTSMTTDSLFSHYKQPTKPLRGPMYLIIEGHSKVKTYGLKTNSSGYHEPNIVPVQPKDTSERSRVVNKDENGIAMEVKHLHQMKPKETLKEPEVAKEPTDAGMTSLLSLLDSSLGNFFSDKKGPEKPADKADSTEDRNGRQIFDYDQLPESELKDMMEMTESEIVTAQPKNLDVSTDLVEVS